MPRTGTPFPYIDRRCQARTALIVHMMARRWPPNRIGVTLKAKAPGLCVDCGTYFDVDADIQRTFYGDPVENRRGMAHFRCPGWGSVLDSFRQESDHRLITHAAIAGRNRAGCGHVTDGNVVFLVHGSGEYALDGIGTWICADCARR